MSRQATYVQKGHVINHLAGAEYAAGDVVVIGSRVGVAQVAIASGAVGAVQLGGVFEMPSVSSAAFAVGDKLYWDDSAQKLTEVVGAVVAGLCIELKATAGAVGKVLLCEFAPVAQAANQADIATANASAPGAGYVQVDTATISTLANANKAAINALLAKLKAAGIMVAD